MKIAVTYENNTVFQHFGRAKEFKIYTVLNSIIEESQVVSCGEITHEDLADLLKANDVDIVICGGIGNGAYSALAHVGIEVCSGADGNCDEIVQLYLDGKLQSSDVNCSHHNHDDESESHGCGGGCCGHGSCGHCSTSIIYEGKNSGKQCKVHYIGTLNDGTKFDSSYDRGQPLAFTCGIGMMIPGFDKSVADMSIGDVIDIHLLPEDAYGQKDSSLIFTIDLDQIPGAETLSVGERVSLYNDYGQPVPVTVCDKTEHTITFDANHELAGKELNFHIELIEVE